MHFWAENNRKFSPFCSDLTAIDPLKYVVDLPENLQEREKFDLYNEMILQLQMARANLLRQQKKPVSCEDLIAFDVKVEGRIFDVIQI
jgi:hypothetical protein